MSAVAVLEQAAFARPASKRDVYVSPPTQDRPLTRADWKRCRTCERELNALRNFYETDRRGYYYPDCRRCFCKAQARRAKANPVALERSAAFFDRKGQERAAIQICAGADLGDRLRARKRRARARPGVGADGRLKAVDGLATTGWAAASYVEMSLAVLDSFTHYAEALMAVFEERIGGVMSPEQREAFNAAVATKARWLCYARRAVRHPRVRARLSDGGFARNIDGMAQTLRSAGGYSEVSLAIAVSFTNYAEAWVQVFERRIARYLSADARSSFNAAVEQRAREAIAADRIPPASGRYGRKGI